MLPDEMRTDLAERVRLYFQNSDTGLRDVALRLQDGGYPDVEIFNFLRVVYSAGYDEGFRDGYDQYNDGA